MNKSQARRIAKRAYALGWNRCTEFVNPDTITEKNVFNGDVESLFRSTRMSAREAAMIVAEDMNLCFFRPEKYFSKGVLNRAIKSGYLRMEGDKVHLSSKGWSFVRAQQRKNQR